MSAGHLQRMSRYRKSFSHFEMALRCQGETELDC